jgi:lysophospholipase
MRSSCSSRLLVSLLVLLAARLGQSAAIEASSKDFINPSYLDTRAFPDAPSKGYVPAIVNCPSPRPTIRTAAALSQSEVEWLQRRRRNTIQPMTELLMRAALPNFDAAAYIANVSSNIVNLPNVAIAVSGGGYRALMNGAGFLAAADSRTHGSTNVGGIGGLLQASTYLSGLSGGGWLVGSMFFNNFSSIQSLMGAAYDGNTAGPAIWEFQNSIVRGPKSKGGISLFNTVGYWRDIAQQVAAKADTGYETSITDYWGRALSYQLINDTNGGAGYTFSSIAKSDHFISGNTPMPILLADGRAPGVKIVALNSTVYEFNPFEIGSWDPTTYAFAPLRYLASNFSAGVIPNNGRCVEGFDQASFVMGTSSSLFNTLLLNNITAVTGELPSFVLDSLTSILNNLDEGNNDIAQYTPNPFFGVNPGTNANAAATQLTLVDGGEDLQNIPLHPLIQPNRAVDVIFSVDSSADTPFNWPNGTAVRASYDRSLTTIANGTLFPPVPDANTFINLGLNRRPTFFGCDPKNFTSSSSSNVIVPPLLIYIPNAPYTARSNVSTFDPTYELEERNAIVRNGYDSATQGNSTIDSNWPKCVACAVLSRSLARTSTAPPAVCRDCFAKYCWNGTLDTRETGSYEPAFIIGEGKTTESAAWSLIVGARTVVTVGLLTLTALLI